MRMHKEEALVIFNGLLGEVVPPSYEAADIAKTIAARVHV
jgi:hypothetical protein